MGTKTPVAHRVSTQVDVAQTYETTVVDRRLRLPVTFISIPVKAFMDKDRLNVPEKLLSGLEVKGVSRVTQYMDTALTHLLKQLLSDGMATTRQFADPAPEEGNLEAFAYYLAHERLIPFEESPLDLVSLSGMLQTAGGVGVGAYVGVVAGSGTPLLFVTVPAGMIIGGAAAGVARALEAGLQYRLLGLLGVPQSSGKAKTRVKKRAREQVRTKPRRRLVRMH